MYATTLLMRNLDLSEEILVYATELSSKAIYKNIHI